LLGLVMRIRTWISICPGGERGRPFVRMPASSISTSSGRLDTDDRSFRMRAAPEPASSLAGASVLAWRALAQSAGRSRTIAISARAAIGTVRRASCAGGVHMGSSGDRRLDEGAKAGPKLVQLFM